MTLYAHNQEAYEAISKCFETEQRAAVVHATGTGKSYIIARTAEDFKRVLVIAPNHFVLNETQKVCPKGTEFRTYASVMYDEAVAYDYELIVLDEFHRSGAEKWGEGVRKLLDACPDAKILGTSATHIRYLDGQRNMADELFDGHIVSHIGLKDAIDREILPNPTYVSALYRIDEITETLTQRIMKSNKLDEKKTEGLRILKGIAQSWDKSEGVPGIMRKYMTHDMQRIIVFCSKVSKKEEARHYIGSWLASAGFKRVRFYNIDYKEKRLEKEMEDFQQPCREGELKVAMSVNMLNEGVHIPRVDGIIMLRSTVSRIILEQQVGRCLTAAIRDRAPVVLDLVNNMESVDNFGIAEFGDWEHGGDATDGGNDAERGFPFHITDEIRDIRALLLQLDNEFSAYNAFAFEEKCKEIEAFKQERGELPNTTNGGRALYMYMSKFRSEPLRSMHPECVERLARMGFDMVQASDRYQQIFDRCVAFKVETGRAPMAAKGASKEEMYLGNFLKRHWQKRTHYTDEQRLELCRMGLVSSLSEDVWYFAEKQKRMGNLPADVEYGKRPVSAQVDDVIAHFKLHGSLPSLRSADGYLMRIAQNCIASGSTAVVRMYEAGIFNGTLKMTSKVAEILKHYGIDVATQNIKYRPKEILTQKLAEYGTIDRYLQADPKDAGQIIRTIYISATDDECVEMFNQGIYVMNFAEVRNRLKPLAHQHRIDINEKDIRQAKKYKISDADLLAFCKKLGRLPIVSHKEEASYYYAIRSRWSSKTADPEYLQHLIDVGLYLPTSKRFNEMCEKYDLKVRK